jgi:PAS domain S-box-containing protein
VSEGAEEVTGLAIETIFRQASAVTDLIVPEDQPRFFDAMQQSIRTLSPFDVVCRLQWQDGSLHWVHFRSAVRPMPDGGVVCEGILLNITGHRRAAEALVESQARNQAILSALPDMMFVLGADGTYLDVHVSDAQRLLLPPDQFLGKNMSEILSPELAQLFRACFEQVRTLGSASVDYALVLHGERRHFEARMVPCGTDQILSIVRDVTESKRVQHEAQHSRLELAHISRVTVLGEITASIAHELNQPLTAILSNAQAAQHVIAAGHDSSELGDMLADIVEADQRAGDVIRRLRTWLSRDQFLPLRLSMNQVILDVEPLIRSELIMRHVRLTLALDAAVPDVTADRVQLQQVILNLALNGIDAMQERPFAERQLTIATSASGGVVQCTVRDRGTGIQAEHMERLFDAFFSTKPNGLGIGLRICSSIMSAHRGRIWAENNADGGATFFFALPAADVEA